MYEIYNMMSHMLPIHQYYFTDDKSYERYC